VKIEFRLITAAVVAAVLISAAVAGGARFRSLDEDAAIAFLQRTLKRDHVYEKRISLDCIAYGTEGTTDAYFEFVLRECTTPNAAAILKQVLPLIVTASIAARAKSSSGKQLKTNGMGIRARKLSSVRTQVALAEASAIMTFRR
jgi:hypothetical protein